MVDETREQIQRSTGCEPKHGSIDLRCDYCSDRSDVGRNRCIVGRLFHAFVLKRTAERASEDAEWPASPPVRKQTAEMLVIPSRTNIPASKTPGASVIDGQERTVR